MRYAYKDLGEQPAGTTVRLRLAGSSANVLLLDQQNYALYRSRRPFGYQGGLYSKSPVEVTIPRDGHWYLVVDLGGHRGRVRATLEQINPPDGNQAGDSAVREGEALQAVR